MMGFLLVLAGTFLASVALSYAWWTRIRVINLQQDIFDIRDRMFDEALRLGRLNDPAYRETRLVLNSVAHSAHIVASGPVLIHLSLHQPAQRTKPRSECPEVQSLIEESLEQAGESIAHYILRHTISGIILLALARFIRSKEIVTEKILQGIRLTMGSSIPHRFADAEQTAA